MRIGIAGSENSHARIFASLLNCPDGWEGRRVSGAQVTHLLPDTPEQGEAIARDCLVGSLCHSPEEMMGRVDAVLCLDRRGSRHAQQAAPFLSAGLPVFIDKPLARDPAEARAILETAERSGSTAFSFSTVPFARQARELATRAAAEKPAMVQVSGHADPECEYDGLFFYGIHSTELLCALAGTGVRSVAANRAKDGITVLCQYGDGREAGIHLNLNPAGFMVALRSAGQSGPNIELDIADCYAEGLAGIVDVLSGRKPPPPREQMLEPIEIIAAVERSLAEDREVPLSEFRP